MWISMKSMSRAANAGSRRSKLKEPPVQLSKPMILRRGLLACMALPLKVPAPLVCSLDWDGPVLRASSARGNCAVSMVGRSSGMGA